MTIPVPTTPPLATVPDVELMRTGQWNISTGTATFIRDDLAGAVAAVDCPAIRRPVLKLGHTEPDPEAGIRWDGEPAVGWIDNMALINGGHTLVGDYVGMPGWLGDVIASAYPDRSVECWWDFRCQLGHTHPCVVTAVALLGIVRPGIGTLQSLQDVASLYGVAASSPQPGHGQAVTVHCKGAPMPNPSPLQVAAAVTSEDVRRQYYEHAAWSVWICEMQLDPLQLITVDDTTGQYARVPVTLDGETITFGDAIPVAIEYVDVPASTPAAASTADGQSRRVVYASRAESRPGPQPGQGAPQASQTTPVEPGPNPTEGEAMPALDEGLRERLGLSADADEAAILAAVDELTEAATAPPTPAPEPVAASLPPGTVLMDETQLTDLRAAAEDGRAAREQQRTEARDAAITAAIGDGRITPARREHWQTAWEADPEGTAQTLASLAPGLVPLADVGAPGGEPDATAEDAEFDRLFSRPVPAGRDA